MVAGPLGRQRGRRTLRARPDYRDLAPAAIDGRHVLQRAALRLANPCISAAPTLG
jgi:hypothetical protein